MENWTVENLGREKFMLRNADGRCIAVVSFLAKPEVFERNVLSLFVNSNRMFDYCRKVVAAWKDGDRAASFALARDAEEIVTSIEGGSCSK